MATKYWIGGTATWDNVNDLNWSTSSGGANDTTHPTSGDAVVLDDASGGGTVTLGADISVTSITCGAFTGTLDFAATNPTMQTFANTGTGTRTVSFGSAIFTMTGNAGTIWNSATQTNLTTTANTAVVNFTYAGSTGTRTIALGAVGTPGNHPAMNITAGTDTVTLNSSNFSDLNFTGFAGNATGASTMNIYGNLTMSATMTSTISGVFGFKATSGTKTITMNGVAMVNAFTFDGVGGTWNLQDNLVTTGTITITNGTFNANAKTLTCGAVGSGTGTKVFTITNSILNITGVNGVSLSSAGLTVNATGSTINFTAAGATFSGSNSTWGNLNFTAGGTILGPTSSATCNNLTVTGVGASDVFQIRNSGSWTINGALTLTGSSAGTPLAMTTQTAGTTATCTVKGTTTFDKCTFTDWNLTLNGASASCTLSEDLTLGGNGATTLTVTQGVFNDNNKNVAVKLFAASNTNTRTITKGTGLWTLTGTGTVWNTATTTGLTFTDAGTTKITDEATAAGCTFSGGGLSYNTLWFARGANTESNTLVGNNSFVTLKDDGSEAHSLLFTAASTTSANNFEISGTSGKLITLNSTSTDTFNLIATEDIQSRDYLNIQHSVATPLNHWYAGANSVDNQADETAGSGWLFTIPPNPGQYGELWTRQECFNNESGVNDTIQDNLIRLTSHTNRNDATIQDLANIWAETTGLTTQEALNVKAGTTGLTSQEALNIITA